MRPLRKLEAILVEAGLHETNARRCVRRFADACVMYVQAVQTDNSVRFISDRMLRASLLSHMQDVAVRYLGEEAHRVGAVAIKVERSGDVHEVRAALMVLREAP